VVSGAPKAPAVGRVLQGEGDPHELPALLIRPTPGRLWWLLDKAAASR
jgi:6-phosphogluconolactonase/glucosamine-6-phosphate isomerase/deaminase